MTPPNSTPPTDEQLDALVRGAADATPPPPGLASRVQRELAAQDAGRPARTWAIAGRLHPNLPRLATAAALLIAAGAGWFVTRPAGSGSRTPARVAGPVASPAPGPGAAPEAPGPATAPAPSIRLVSSNASGRAATRVVPSDDTLTIVHRTQDPSITLVWMLPTASDAPNSETPR